MKNNYSRRLKQRKQRITKRLEPRTWDEQEKPMFSASNIHYEVAGRTAATGCGGIGAMHLMVQRLGLDRQINQSLHLLKIHLPYHESDHVLNIAYNVLAGGTRLEDIELRRQDEVYLNGLGAQRLPDPTTAGDFTRRFKVEDVVGLQEAINRSRLAVWKLQPADLLHEALVDVDGTIAGTLGECKAGIDLSYKGIWGYAPLLVSLANTKEVLYVVNRPGNAASHTDSVEWIDRAIDLVGQVAHRVTIRGDTDFSHTAHLDRWDKGGTRFVLGMDAHPKLVGLAQSVSGADWKPLRRQPKYTIATQPRQKPERVKEELVIEKGFRNLELQGEDLTEISYQPAKCAQAYRVIILRKDITVKEGRRELFQEYKYFFYITNRVDSAEQIVALANGRCDQENVIEQLKNGVNAMRMPVADLVSNWAYMVMAGLAWNLKAWFGLLMPDRAQGLELVRMEFRRFLQTIMLLPCQVVRTARRVIFRILSYNAWLEGFFATWERLLKLAPG